MTELVQVDAFTDQPFTGNPAAVCLLAGPASERWMQAVAAETNLPATAFVWPVEDGFGLRWFTTAKELSLCGHGTLASAHALFQRGVATGDGTIRFHTHAGQLIASRRNDRIELDFRAERSAPVAAPADLVRALDQRPLQVERNRLDYLVELDSEDAVRGIQPDFALLRRVAARGVIVSARASTIGDFVSRFFVSSLGIEDSVTGSAHCALGPYWEPKLGKSDMVGVQLSARGGVVQVRVAGDRVFLSGQAVTILSGTLADDVD